MMNNTNYEQYEFKPIGSFSDNCEVPKTSVDFTEFQYIKVHVVSDNHNSLAGSRLRDFHGEQKEKIYLDINKRLGEF